jgi:DNA polymerase-3 subunit delta'
VEDKRERRAIEKRTEERAKRTARRAQTDELREAVDVVGLWYRDLMATALGGEGAVINSDVAGELVQDAKSGSPAEAARAVGIVLEARRSLELNVQPALAVEAMFHRLRLAPAGG